ncbi:MAG: site-specific DNA-methyltransferase [Myxococcales bacterium]|nr:site-specific DNA-methyltransferase [Myxococcales bacterium]
MSRRGQPSQLTLDYDARRVGRSWVIHADCLEWLSRVPEGSLHAIVTDPPYGLKEYEVEQLRKRDRGRGGIWRIPPSFDGSARAPLPRFTALDARERARLRDFFRAWSELVTRALRPGGHVLIATNAFIADLLYEALTGGGLEFRGQLIRTVRTLRGGDRPKNAEAEFPDACSMPRGCYEPWGLLRRPLPRRMTVAECLRQHETGALRRYADGRPFEDLIASERTPRRERELAGHPSLKPQSLLRRLVYAALPLGRGRVVDPFMGSGSTVAAGEAVGVEVIGVERHREYFELALAAIPRLRAISLPELEPLLGSAPDAKTSSPRRDRGRAAPSADAR